MSTSTAEVPCFKCISYKAQLEQKEAIIAKYQKIVQFQNDLIQDFSHGQKITVTSTSTTNSGTVLAAREKCDFFFLTQSELLLFICFNVLYFYLANRSYYRTYIGPLSDEVDKGSLRQCLEKSFGPVNNIDFIPGKVYIHINLIF
jgi:hypothetical protein